MAGYAFETMSSDDAASFGADDYLFFITKGATANAVTVASYQNGAVGSGIQLTYGGKSLTFPNTISAASFNNHIQFNDSTHLEIGTEGVNGSNTAAAGAAPNGFTVPADGQPTTVYALGGNDTIDFSGAATRSANYLNGGFGADTINGGAGNNHIYGNSMTSQSGALDSNGNVDGGDTITVTTGSNYINGNGGNDIINVGVTGNAFQPATMNAAAVNGTASTGANRIFGGSGNDTVTILGQGANSVNGNVGNDVINASNSSGNNTLRGGADQDIITGGRGQTIMMGDNGADTLIAGAGTTSTLNDGSTTQKLSIMTGGANNDIFDFGTNGATAGYAGTVDSTNSYTHSGVTISGTTYYQTITDFTQGQDTIHLSFSGTTTATAVDIVKGAASFTSVSAAEVYAQGLLANHTLSTSNGTTAAGEVAAIDVNGSTFLFYHAAGGETPANAGTTPGIDSIIQLTGVSSSTLTQQGTGVHTFS